SEFYVWHIAYRPLVRAQPQYGVLVLEPHGGSPSPELEAELRGVGEVSPAAGRALVAAFIPTDGPAVHSFATTLVARPAASGRPLVQLAGALWHGTSLLPPPLVDFNDALGVWPADGRNDYALACARIGGNDAARALAALVRDGRVAANGPWLAAAARSGRATL